MSKWNTRPAPSTERKLLGWVNRMRKLIDPSRRPLRRLPKGDVGDAFSCPLARAVAKNSEGEVSVDGHTVEFYLPGAERRRLDGECPKYVTKFVEEFDHGRYPGLELGNYDSNRS